MPSEARSSAWRGLRIFPSMSEPDLILCPYCGRMQPVASACSECSGRFDLWSLRATQNDMGAWFVRNSSRPHFVGCSYATLLALVRAGEVGRDTVVRGPSTRQFWTVARRVPGLAHLFGRCHGCQGPVTADSPVCAACGAEPFVERDRNLFGLASIEPVERPLSISDDTPSLVKAAFASEGRVYFVRASPAAASDRVQPPVRAVVPVRPSDERAPASAPASGSQLSGPSSHQSSSQSSSLGAARGAISAIDRGLSERVRELTRLNRMLLVATIAATASALVLAGAYVVLRDARDREILETRSKAIAEVRAEFERKEPVAPARAASLPEEPDAPPTAARPPEVRGLPVPR